MQILFSVIVITISGVISFPFTTRVSPAISLPAAGPGGTPRDPAFSGSNLGFIRIRQSPSDLHSLFLCKIDTQRFIKSFEILEKSA